MTSLTRVPRAPRLLTRLGPGVLVAAFLYGAPVVGGRDEFKLLQFDQVICFIIMAVALNIAMGLAGQYLAGITAVFGLGAYAAVVAAQHHPGIGLVGMCAIGAVVAGAGGLVIGLAALRVAGFYLALVSLFVAVALPTVAQEWDYVGGREGIPLFIVDGFEPKLLGYRLYAVLVTLLLLSTLLSWALAHSPIGRQFVALHTSDQLTTSLGIAPYAVKIAATAVSSVLAGVSGGLYVYSQQFFSPGSATADLSILILAAIVIGGMGTVWGPVVGGVIVLGLSQFVTAFNTYNNLVYGGLLLLFAVFLPQGLVKQVTDLVARLAPGGAALENASPLSPGAGTGAVSRQRLPWGPEPGAAVTDPDESLVLREVSKAFGGVQALDAVDLAVEPGTVHGLIGSNGSGKTTLLNLVSGFYRLDHGEVVLGATRLDRLPPHRVARAGVARTFQSPKLMFGASALENVQTAVERRARCTGIESVLRLPRGVSTTRRSHEAALEALDFMGLGALADEQAGELPHGTRRMVELARAVAMRPRFILMDEPAAGLSPAELDLLVSSIRSVAAAGVGVLLIEHNVPVVLEMAKQVTVLHQGRLLFRGTPDELRDDHDVASAFLGIDAQPGGTR